MRQCESRRRKHRTARSRKGAVQSRSERDSRIAPSPVSPNEVMAMALKSLMRASMAAPSNEQEREAVDEMKRVRRRCQPRVRRGKAQAASVRSERLSKATLLFCATRLSRRASGRDTKGGDTGEYESKCNATTFGPLLFHFSLGSALCECANPRSLCWLVLCETDTSPADSRSHEGEQCNSRKDGVSAVGDLICRARLGLHLATMQPRSATAEPMDVVAHFCLAKRVQTVLRKQRRQRRRRREAQRGRCGRPWRKRCVQTIAISEPPGNGCARVTEGNVPQEALERVIGPLIHDKDHHASLRVPQHAFGQFGRVRQRGEHRLMCRR